MINHHWASAASSHSTVWLGVMRGNALWSIHLHLVQKQIVFVPLYFSIHCYLFFVSMPLPNTVLRGNCDFAVSVRQTQTQTQTGL